MALSVACGALKLKVFRVSAPSVAHGALLWLATLSNSRVLGLAALSVAHGAFCGSRRSQTQVRRFLWLMALSVACGADKQGVLRLLAFSLVGGGAFYASRRS